MGVYKVNEYQRGGGGGSGLKGKASHFAYNSYSTYLIFNFIDILQWKALTSKEILRFIQFHVKTNTQQRGFFWRTFKSFTIAIGWAG